MSWSAIEDQLENAPDAASFFQTLADQLTELFSAAYSEVVWVDELRNQCVLIASGLVGFHGKPPNVLEWPIDIGLHGRIYKRKEPLIFSRLHHHPDYNSQLLEVPESVKHALILPIIYRQKIRGMVVCYGFEDHLFSSEDVARMLTFGVRISGQFYRRLSELQEELVLGSSTVEHEHTLTGTPCSPGVAMGKVVVVSPPADLDAVVLQKTTDVSAEIASLTTAVSQVKQDINHLSTILSKSLPDSKTDIFSAYCHMIDRHGLVRDITERILEEECNVASGLKMVIAKYIRDFERMDDPYLRARMIDVKDIGRRILSYLYSEQRKTRKFPTRTILAGYDLAPMAIAEVPEGQLVGVFCARGSRYSHASILARAIGVPTIVGVQDLVMQGLDGGVVLLDGYTGQVVIHPSKTRRQDFKKLIAIEEASQDKYEDFRGVPAETKDGMRVSLQVNVGLGTDIQSALKVAADGIGLFRTEIPFMMRSQFPSEEEQCMIYNQILKAFSPKPVVLRTIDVGGDKHLPYWEINESNPYLGWRGIRLCLDQSHILKIQLRAMLKASEGMHNVAIMIPMVSHVGEMKVVRETLESIHQELLSAGHKILKPSLGMMIEVPSVIYQIPQMSKYVDFFSVGTNDLTQYLLAVDRNNHRVSHLYDYWHPAVLWALIGIINGVREVGKPVSVCGEMAGDPMSAMLLVAMGYKQLSMSPKSLSKIRWVLRHFTYAEGKQLLAQVQGCSEADEVVNIMKTAFRKAGLARLIGESIETAQLESA